MRYKITRSFYIGTGQEEIIDEAANAVAYLSPMPNGRYGAMGFGGKRQRPDFNYSFTDEAIARAYVKKYFESQRETAKAKAEYRQGQKEFQTTLQAGDILYASWGYDQTNVDWYQVIEVKSGKTVVLREIAGKSAGEEGWMCGYTEPVKDEFVGEPMTKRIRKGDVVTIDDVRHAYKWNGKPKYWSSYA